MVLDVREGMEKGVPLGNLQCIIDIGNKTITFDTNDLYVPDIHLFFGFRTNGEQNSVFTDMTFGYDLSIQLGNGVTQFVTSAELPGYIQTDAEYSEHRTHNLIAEKDYGLSVWCKNNGERFSGQTTFRIANWQEYYPAGIDVPQPGTPEYGRINVADPWWI